MLHSESYPLIHSETCFWQVGVQDVLDLAQAVYQALKGLQRHLGPKHNRMEARRIRREAEQEFNEALPHLLPEEVEEVTTAFVV